MCWMDLWVGPYLFGIIWLDVSTLVILGRKRGSVERIATMGGSPVMYNLSSLAKTKLETDDGHVSVVQVSGGWSEQRVAESVG